MFSIRTCQSEKSNRESVEQNITALNDTIKYHKDKEGIMHAAILAQEGTINDLAATTQAALDSTSKRLQIAKGDIEGYQKTVAQIKNNVVVKTVTVHDTVNFTYQDENTNETGTIIHDTLHEQLTMTVPITLTEYSKRKNLFAPTLHYIDGSSSNENAKITGLESVLVVKEKPKAMRTIEAVGIGFLVGLIIHSVIH